MLVLNCTRALWVQFSSLLQPLWTALTSGVLLTAPVLLVSSASLLRVCSASLHKPLIAMSNGIGASIDPWGMPVLAGCQLEFIQLITTLWVQLSRQFFTHSLLIQLISHWFGSSILWKTMSDAVTGDSAVYLWRNKLPELVFLCN